MEKKSYQTEGRRQLIAFFAAHPDQQYTTEEVCVLLRGDATRGRSSIYRQLVRLCEEEILNRFYSAEQGRSVYQYVGEGCSCRRHFHGKCTLCGRVAHLDCRDSEAFAEHLLRAHGFRIDCGQSMLYGVCADCLAAAEGRETR